MASDVGEVVEKVKSASIAEQAQQVWLSIEEDDAWCKATFVKRDGDKVTMKRDDGAELVLEAEAFGKLPVYFEPTGPPVEDLTKLGDVNDATMLDTLRRRYAADDIFTSIGPVCIALNPYRPVACCSSEAIKSLVDDAGKEETPPHAFKVAQSAFYQLQHAHEAQSILISGESGAGKTETNSAPHRSHNRDTSRLPLARPLGLTPAHSVLTEICLVCLAELSHSSGRATDACLEASLLLETFGNAKARGANPCSRAPVTTVLAAASRNEREKWLKMLVQAVGASGVTGRELKKRLSCMKSTRRGSTKIPDHHDRAAVRNHTVAGQNLQKLAELEEPELKKLKEKQLRAVAEHLNIIYDRKRYNHKKDKDHLVSMILSKQTDGMAADSSDLLDAWGV